MPPDGGVVGLLLLLMLLYSAVVSGNAVADDDPVATVPVAVVQEVVHRGPRCRDGRGAAGARGRGRRRRRRRSGHRRHRLRVLFPALEGFLVLYECTLHCARIRNIARP